MSGDDEVFDAAELREVLGHYASGVTVVTGWCDPEPVGFTCQAFYSVSLDPPLVSISVMRTSTSYPRIAATGRFAVNVLARDQDRISSQFARSGTDKWAGVRWSPAASGNPVMDDVTMWLDCEIWAEHEAGDHLIVIGRVRELGWRRESALGPLIFYRGAYRHLQDQDPLAS